MGDEGRALDEINFWLDNPCQLATPSRAASSATCNQVLGMQQISKVKVTDHPTEVTSRSTRRKLVRELKQDQKKHAESVKAEVAAQWQSSVVLSAPKNAESLPTVMSDEITLAFNVDRSHSLVVCGGISGCMRC